ncbi:unnamed protein product [Citrullus colocynthis]|uniref:BHLH domain-containing protein n=1 Tax=Citrullus colocynthis TaxID=252529 RepID=A0ABP0YSM0_9ROSI
MDEFTKYKSKNLHVERRRRQKLSDNLLLLRATVPIITNMNKATIIDDAITYIHQLQNTVAILKHQLLELEHSSAKLVLCPTPNYNNIQSTHLVKTDHVQADVRVSQIDQHKLWVKIHVHKRKGALTKLIQAFNSLGFELIHTSLITLKGAIIVTSIINGMFCTSTAQQTEDLLLGIINGL